MKRSAAGVLLASLVVLTAPTAPARAETGPQARYALQVAIDDYRAAGISSLDGCVQDAVDLRDVLQQRFGFPASHVLTLADRAATRAAILQSFRTHLIDNARRHPGAVIVFQYSGHGSRVRDTNGDEGGDDLDETLVPYDGRSAGAYDILDDELQALVGELARWTPNILIILDSCHSGSGTRGGSKIRRAPMDPRPQPPQPPAGRAHLETPAVTLSACRANEVAAETDDELENPGRHNGTFTFQLVRALRRARAACTYRELLVEVANAVAEFHPQHPVAEGDIGRPVLGDEADREDPFVAIERASGDAITIAAGSAHGLKRGARLALYSPESRRLVGENGKLADAIVEEVRPLSSTARMDRSLDLPAGVKVVVVTPLLGDAPLRVALPERSEPDMRGAAVSALLAGRGPSLLEFVPGRETRTANASPADVRLVRAPFPTATSPGTLSAKTRATPDTAAAVWYVQGRDREPLGGYFESASDSQSFARLREHLENIARKRNVRAIANAVSPLAGQFDLLVIPERAVPDTVGPDTWSRLDSLTRSRAAGEWSFTDTIRVALRNRTANDLYFTLLDLSTDETIACLAPPQGDDGLVRAGGWQFTGPFTFTPPAGIETLKLFVTTQPRDFRTLLTHAPGGRTRGGDALDELLGGAVHGTRGAEPVRLRVDDWATTQVDLSIGPADR